MQDLPYKRELGSVAVDAVFIVVAYYAAYVLRFEEAFAANKPMLIRTLAPVLVCQLSGLALSGAYRGMWRYTGLGDLLRLGRGITVGTVAAVLYLLFTTRFAGMPRDTLASCWLFGIASMPARTISVR